MRKRLLSMILVLFASANLFGQVFTETNTSTWFIYPQVSGTPPAGWEGNPALATGWVGAGIDPCTWATNIVSPTAQRLLGSTFTSASAPATAYFYTTFTVTSISDIIALEIKYNVDDSATFWLNGTVIKRTGYIAGGRVDSQNVAVANLQCGTNILAVKLSNVNTGCFFVQAQLNYTTRTTVGTTGTLHNHTVNCSAGCDTVNINNYTFTNHVMGNVTWNDGTHDTVKVFCSAGTYIATTTINGCTDIDTFVVNTTGCCDTCNWKVSGNNITTPTRNIFGTLTNDNVRIYTNSVQRGVLTSTGNFGWNTPAPTAFLHVNCTSPVSQVRFENLATAPVGNTLIIDPSGNVWNSGVSFTPGISSTCSTANIVPKVSGPSGNLTCSQIFDDGTSVGINATSGFNYTSLSGARLGTIPAPAAGVITFEVNGVGRSLANIVTSDANLKTDIKDIPKPLEIVKLLMGKTYMWNQRAQTSFGADNGLHVGYLAQDLQKVIPEVVITDNEGVLGVNYTEIIPILSEAIKEQQLQIEKLEQTIQKLTGTTGISDNKVGDGYLAQNVPNPFSVSTEIKYQLPNGTQKAAIGIYDMNGREIRLFNLPGDKNGAITIQGGDLMPGMYLYSLIVDGKQFDTKRMVLTSR